LGLWRYETVGQPMLAVPFGRDVVVDVRHFTLAGRRNRNLRQAVQRSHNCGVTTEVVDERDLDSVLMSELGEVLYAAHRAARTERGFCMNLDSVLQGRIPGIKLVIARDRCGQVVASVSYTHLDVYKRQDQKLGWKHFFDWERCAVVTDVAWAKHIAKFSEFFGFLWPGEYRAFPEAEASKARDWICLLYTSRCV